MEMMNSVEIENSPNIKIIDFCNDKKIPYLKVHVDTTKPKKKGYPSGSFTGWQKKTYDELMEYNKINNPKHNTLFINLEQSDYFVIDIDDKELGKNKYELYGSSWETKSISKGLPHLWRLKDSNSSYSNTINKDDDKVDIITLRIYEKLDGYFYNTEHTMPIEANPNKVDTKKKVKKIISKLNKKNVKINSEAETDIKNIISNENRDILNNIDIKYWNNYQDWLKLIWALYNTYNDINVCDFYSKKSTSYVDIKDVKKYVMCDTQKSLSFGTIAYYSKLSNAYEYKQIRIRYNSLQLSDFDISNSYLNIIGDNIIKHNNQLYIYKKPFWVLDKDKTIILKDLRTTLLKFYADCISFWTEKYRIAVKDELKEDADYSEGVMARYQKAIKNISTSSKQKSILEQIYITLDDNDYKLDLINPNIFAFSCGTIFDVIQNEKIISNKYDYISNHTGYAYMESEQKDIDLLNKIIIDIFPNVEIRKTYLSVLKQTLLGKPIEKFILFNGEGCNGKGWTLELLKELLNNYMVNANKDILVSPIKTGANSELARFNMKRCIVFSEPEEGTRLNGSTIKQLTGGGVMEARGLYEDAKDINILATQILECNQRPAIKGRTDNAMLRRIVDIYFEVILTDDDNLVKEDPKKYIKRNHYYKSQEFKNIHKYALFNLLMSVEDNTIYISKEVEKRSKEYIMGNDELLEWVNESVTITDNKDDIVKIKDLFELFKMSDFYKNLSMIEKRNEWNKQNFIEKIKLNKDLVKYYKDRNMKINQHFTNMKFIEDDVDYIDFI